MRKRRRSFSEARRQAIIRGYLRTPRMQRGKFLQKWGVSSSLMSHWLARDRGGIGLQAVAWPIGGPPPPAPAAGDMRRAPRVSRVVTPPPAAGVAELRAQLELAQQLIDYANRRGAFRDLLGALGGQ